MADSSVSVPVAWSHFDAAWTLHTNSALGICVQYIADVTERAMQWERKGCWASFGPKLATVHAIVGYTARPNGPRALILLVWSEPFCDLKTTMLSLYAGEQQGGCCVALPSVVWYANEQPNSPHSIVHSIKVLETLLDCSFPFATIQFSYAGNFEHFRVTCLSKPYL